MGRTLLILAGLLLLAAAPAGAVSYAAPDVSKATLVFEEVQYVADSEPATEILIKTYMAGDGTGFRVFSVGGNIFRYDVDTDGAEPFEYRLLDNDGDGEFETRERVVAGEATREGGKRFFKDLGPEPGFKYGFEYEKTGPPSPLEERQLMMNYPIYIPSWVVKRY